MEKTVKKNKRRKVNGKFLFIGILVFLLGAYLIFITNNENAKPVNLEEYANSIDVYFLKMDEADATVIINNDKVTVIDTGLSEDQEYVINRLKELNVEKIAYLILTHPDKDHIGNASEIIKNFEVETVIQSTHEKGSKIQDTLDTTILENNITNLMLNNAYSFSSSGVKYNIFPASQKYNKSNNNSLVTLITFGTTKILMTGDIEKERIEEVVALDLGSCDILKLPHHGRYNDNSIIFLDMVKPQHVVVTASMVDEPLATYFNDNQTNVYYTANNEVHFTTDGKEVKVG
ncbi:MAG: MBL fold metallo-hydrolase [bacterium]|nr:MBL fold metallo-hydrolase [bacterium]